jgi:hypothetical protein
LIEVRRWLEPRLRDIPASLRDRIVQAFEAHASPDASSPAHSLRTVANALLEEAKQGHGGGRDVALTLLAADALVTYACEVTAETDPDQLGELR